MTAPQARLGGLLANRWVAASLVLVLFIAVFVLRATVYNPDDGIGMLFCIPIAVAAVRFGPVAGVTAGIVGWLLFVVWAFSGDADDLATVAFISRAVVFLLLGGAIGHFARARAEVDLRSRLLFDVSPDMMGTLALDGSRLAVNEAWTELVRQLAQPTTVRTSLAHDFPAPGQSAIVERRVSLASGESMDIEWHLQRDLRHPLVYAVGRDVTERNEHVEHVRELLAAVQTARVDERNRVASELHDFVLQQLLVVLMHTEGDAAWVHSDEHVRSAVAALRRVIDGIQPLDLQFVDLATTLERTAEHVCGEWGIDIVRTIDTSAQVGTERKLLAYRITGEALRNAAKHAAARTIELIVRDVAGEVEVVVRDDGRGVAAGVDARDRIVPEFGAGFNLLVEQLLVDGGGVAVLSEPGVGTTVTFRFSARSAE